VFVAVRLLPGDVIDQMSSGYGKNDPELRRQLARQYSLDVSMPEQYAGWVAGLARGDLGRSIATGRPISQDLVQRLPTTFELGLLAMLVSCAIALPVGVVSAVRQDTPVDYAGRSLAIGMLAIPSFWLALLAITYGFVLFRWTPPLQYSQLWEDPAANLKILWLPALILGAALAGSVMRYTRSMVLEVLRQDYIRTAWAKGLRERMVILRHALPNALIPVITVIGLQVPILVGGTVILETVFSIPGMGSFLLQAVQQRDYPVVQGVVLISAVVVVITNLIVDLSYSVLDPRLKT
jgi:peptide/nickel transport system permease protein